MPTRRWNPPEIIAALAVLGFGAAVAILALGYRIGTVARMGPGFFPLMIGIAIAALALVLVIMVWREDDRPPEPFKRRAMTFVIAGVAAFGLLVERAGLIPATFALVALSALAEPPFRPWAVLLSAVALSILGIAVFIYGLKLPLRMIRW